MIAKPIGPLCNLDCKYCFYLEKEQLFNPEQANGNPHFQMSGAVLESYIQQKLENSRSSVETFLWQGGEPTLLGVDYFRDVVKLQQKYAAGKRINNSLQTNGTLLDDTWCEFLKENNWLVGISIDGPQAYHDKYRVDKAGEATFEKVIQGLALLKKHKVEFNTLTAVHNDNANFPLDIYHFLKESGSKFMQFIPIVEKAMTSPLPMQQLDSEPGCQGEIPRKQNMDEKTGSNLNHDLSEWSVGSLQYGNFLNVIFDEWVQRDVGQVFIQNFDIALETWSGRPSSLCVFNETCGLDPIIEHNGDLFACDHYVSPEYKIGNILNDSLQQVVQSPQQLKFGQDKRNTLSQMCRECQFLFACYGGCPKHRFTSTPAGEAGLNYLCVGYQQYFKHIEPYMEFMVHELQHRRPPANVMAWDKCTGINAGWEE